MADGHVSVACYGPIVFCPCLSGPCYRRDANAVISVQVFQPHTCKLKPWNAAAFSQCIKGRRLIFMGDSTTRQQFQSLACLLGPVIASEHASEHWNDSSITGAHSLERPATSRHVSSLGLRCHRPGSAVEAYISAVMHLSRTHIIACCVLYPMAVRGGYMHVCLMRNPSSVPGFEVIFLKWLPYIDNNDWCTAPLGLIIRLWGRKVGLLGPSRNTWHSYSCAELRSPRAPVQKGLRCQYDKLAYESFCESLWYNLQTARTT